MSRFVVLAPNRWDGVWMNRQQIFSRVAERHFVLYSTGAVHLRQKAVRAASAAAPVRRPGGVLIDQPSPVLRRIPSFGLWDRFVIERTARRWRRLAGPREAGPLVAYVFHPKFWPYVECLGADCLVYHAYDMFERSRGWSSKLDEFQRCLVQRADLAVASSEMIADVLERRYGRRPTVIANGADDAAFACAADTRTADPDELRSVPAPRIGYFGALSRKVDFQLIAGLARRRREWQFVLMGEIRSLDDATAKAFSEARREPNVVVLPARPHHAVPAYVSAMDVNIMCYRLTDDLWVEAGYPLKLHEYLAAGRPVVSADLPSVRPFGDVVAIARTEDEWERAIDLALRTGQPGSVSARRAVAAANSWSARVRQLEGELALLAQ